VSSAAETLREDPVPQSPVAPPAEAVAPDDLPLVVIERQPGWRFLDLGELWRYRELLYFLTWRDIKVRYKQTVLGVVWAVLQPFATMVVFSLFLGRMAGVAPPDVPYPLFVFAGLLPWTFFASAVSSASQSIVGNQNLVTKVYFPRLIIPMGAVAASLVDLAIAFVLLLGMMGFYRTPPGWSVLLLPPIVLGLVVAAVGVGVLLSALTVAYRDFRYVVPFLVQLWMFATPSIYLETETVVGPTGLALLPLNPAQGLISNFRAAMLGQPLDLYSLGVSAAVSVVLLVAGCTYFRCVERGFADVI
jgi:lipopolysaccharide transport system permease protein